MFGNSVGSDTKGVNDHSIGSIRERSWGDDMSVDFEVSRNFLLRLAVRRAGSGASGNSGCRVFDGLLDGFTGLGLELSKRNFAGAGSKR